MASHHAPAVFGVERSLAGRAWRWRGGNMEMAEGIAGLEDDIVTQLLLARGRVSKHGVGFGRCGHACCQAVALAMDRDRKHEIGRRATCQFDASSQAL